MTCSCGKPLKYRTRSCIDCFTRDRLDFGESGCTLCGQPERGAMRYRVTHYHQAERAWVVETVEADWYERAADYTRFMRSDGLLLVSFPSENVGKIEEL